MLYLYFYKNASFRFLPSTLLLSLRWMSLNISSTKINKNLRQSITHDDLNLLFSIGMLPKNFEKECRPKSPPGPPPKLEPVYLSEYPLVQSASVSRSKIIRPTIKSTPSRSSSLSRSTPILTNQSSPISRSESPAKIISHIIHKKFIE